MQRHTCHITLNNPGKANILDKPTSDAISDAWIDLWEDREIRCAIVTGARHFCGGHNLASRPDRSSEEDAKRLDEAYRSGEF